MDYISEHEPLSFRTSLIKSYLKCPALCYFRYFKGLVIPPKSYATMGSCTHETAEYTNRYKVKRGKEPKLTVLQDVFYESFKTRKKHTQWLKKEDPKAFEREGIKLIVPAYYHKIAKKVEPKYVEKSFEVEFPKIKLKVTGTIDLIEENNLIRDLKTKSRTPNWMEAMKSFQGKSYKYGFKIKFGKEPKGFMLDFLIRKGVPEVFSSEVVKPSSRDDLEFESICTRVAQGIRKGMFYPHREGNYFCSPTACGFWRMCSAGDWRKLSTFTGIYGRNDGGDERGEI